MHADPCGLRPSVLHLWMCIMDGRTAQRRCMLASTIGLAVQLGQRWIASAERTARSGSFSCAIGVAEQRQPVAELLGDLAISATAAEVASISAALAGDHCGKMLYRELREP